MSKAPDDSVLLTAFQSYDRGAEKEVFHRWFRPLCIYSERITTQLEPAEDIVAEAFIKAVASRDEKAIERVVARIHALRSADDDAA